ncbi:polyamine deacetylase HDAC10 [Rhinophrynus dorsalis]
MESRTALVYDEEMMNYKLLWDDPECAIEVPERLSASYKRLQHYELVERCVRLPVREASEEEILLVHSPDYLEVVKSTQTMNEEELQKTSQNYTAAFFHKNSYRCAKLSLGGTLQLVDSVMSGEVHNGMALIRPPGHHSQRSQSNGFCIFNNVAVAAEYAKHKYKLQRILIVDWDVHHGQGIQYIFEEDPSVLYFSWHRYEHKTFWPYLSESDYDEVGKGKGAGFNINLPWNKVGMGNADYISAFLHVLLPLAFEFNPELVLVSAGYDSAIGDPEGLMCATPECFAHLTHLLMSLAGGKLCAILEGGYNLTSLAESVCMTVRTLLGDPVPRLTGEMAPCYSALESIQNVRAAHTPYWKCLLYDETKLVQDPSTKGKSNSEIPSAQQQSSGTDFDSYLESHMKKILHQLPTTIISAVVPKEHSLLLPGSVQVEENSVTREQMDVSSSFFSKELSKKKNIFISLGKMLTVLNKLADEQTKSGIALSPDTSLSAAIALQHVSHSALQRSWSQPNREELDQSGGGSKPLREGRAEKATSMMETKTYRRSLLWPDLGATKSGIALSPDTSLSAAIALQHVSHSALQRVFYIHIGDMDTKPDVNDDGKTLLLRICGDLPPEINNSKYQISLKWKENPYEGSSFFYMMHRCILPLAYSYQPDFIIIAMGNNRSIGNKDVSALTNLLQGLAEGRILAIVQETEPELAEALANILAGCSAQTDYGPRKGLSPECVWALRKPLQILQKEWKMLQCCAC